MKKTFKDRYIDDWPGSFFLYGPPGLFVFVSLVIWDGIKKLKVLKKFT